MSIRLILILSFDEDKVSCKKHCGSIVRRNQVLSNYPSLRFISQLAIYSIAVAWIMLLPGDETFSKALLIGVFSVSTFGGLVFSPKFIAISVYHFVSRFILFSIVLFATQTLLFAIAYSADVLIAAYAAGLATLGFVGAALLSLVLHLIWRLRTM